MDTDVASNTARAETLGRRDMKSALLHRRRTNMAQRLIAEAFLIPVTASPPCPRQIVREHLGVAHTFLCLIATAWQPGSTGRQPAPTLSRSSQRRVGAVEPRFATAGAAKPCSENDGIPAVAHSIARAPSTTRALATRPTQHVLGGPRRIRSRVQDHFSFMRAPPAFRGRSFPCSGGLASARGGSMDVRGFGFSPQGSIRRGIPMRSRPT